MTNLDPGATGWTDQRLFPVRMAILLIWMLIGLLVIRTSLIIVALVSVTAGRDQRFVQDLTPAYIWGICGLALFGGLLAACAVFLSEGARWAQMTGIVISGVTVLGALNGILFQPSTTLFVVINVLVAGTALGVIYYLLRLGTRAAIHR